VKRTGHWIAAASLLAVAGSARAETRISGDYVETRTANIYIGACHANGEWVTTGREGLMAWSVTAGEVDGVRLDGLKAVAIVSAEENLVYDAAARRSLLYIDSAATPEQKEVFATVLRAKYAKALGKVVAVRTAPVAFDRKGLETTVRLANLATVKTTRYSCNHCVMPHMVWYQPFVPVKNAVIAQASVNEFKGAPDLKVSWLRADENSSYVGEFEL
jgi:hypothetical protein